MEFFEPEVGHITSGTFIAPSPASQVLCMIGISSLYFFLTWYCDHVIAHNRGVAEPSYFFLTKKYWKSVFHGFTRVDQDENSAKSKKNRKKKKRRDISKLSSFSNKPFY